MSVIVRITKSFTKAVKPLLKKYPSLSNDLHKLEQQLIEEPRHGISLGQNAYKIRLKISSSGKGKSGGARIITLVEAVLIGEIQITEEEITVNLLAIYDKTRTANITEHELKDLIKAFHSGA